MDRLSSKQRSTLMSKVKTSGTDIERYLLRCVKQFWEIEHYRKNLKTLPGKPDIVFPKSKIAIFADGDFWHGKNFKKWKSKIPAFWRKKISENIQRDQLQSKALRKAGYIVLRFYGSKIKKNPKYIEDIIRKSLK